MDRTFEVFKERWQKKSREINKKTLDGTACMSIYEGFMKEYLSLTSGIEKESVPNFYLEREQLANDVSEALNVAFCSHKRFLRQNSWWYRLFSGDKKLDLSMFTFQNK